MHIPFVGGDEPTAPVGPDPDVPFTVNDRLGYGHTLTFSVYEGVRSASKLFDGSIMVDRSGKAHIPKIGDVNLGGLTPLEAVGRIETKFRDKYEEDVLHVQLEKIEHTPLVTVNGAVHHPGVIQYFDGMTASAALPYVGGREGTVPAKAVYVVHKGIRKTYVDPRVQDPHLEAGDIVTFSGDL